jgi:hypothetical protein
MTANAAPPQTDQLYRLVALFVGGLPVRECCASTEIDGLAPDVADRMLRQVLVDFDNDPALHVGRPTPSRWRTACQSNEVFFDRSVCSEGWLALICYTDTPAGAAADQFNR